MAARTKTKRISSSKPLRILLVENHADTLEYMRMFLETLGYAVSSANTMTGALELLPETDSDMLISDIGLPDGDGWELLHRVRAKLPRPIYAIAMSGYGMGPDQLKSREAGFRHHLLKPFDPRQLAIILEEAARELRLPRD